MRSSLIILLGLAVLEAVAYYLSEDVGVIAVLLHPAFLATAIFVAAGRSTAPILLAGVLGLFVAGALSIANYFFLGWVVGYVMQNLSTPALRDAGPIYSLLVLASAALGLLAGVLGASRRSGSKLF